jgi:hypothetical protein
VAIPARAVLLLQERRSRAGLQSDARLDRKSDMEVIEQGHTSQLVPHETIPSPAVSAKSIPCSGAAFTHLLPDGEYTVTATADVAHDRERGLLLVDFEFRIIDGDHLGRSFWRTVELNPGDPEMHRCERGPWYVYGSFAQVFANNPKVFRYDGSRESASEFSANFSPPRPGLVTIKDGAATSCRKCEPPARAHFAEKLQTALVGEISRIESGSAPQRETSVPEFVLRPPGILSELACAITETAPLPQPQLSTLAALSFAATVMGQLYVGPTGFGSNLYLLGVADSGAGKDRPQKAVLAALLACGLAHFVADEPASGSALLTHLGESPNTLMIIDEFGKFARAIVEQKAGAHQREIATHMLKLSGEPQPQYISRMYARPEERKQRPIRYACLNILAATTPSTFYSCLSREQVDDGLMGRMVTLAVHGRLPETNARQGSFCAPPSLTDWARKIRVRVPHDPMVVATAASPFRIAYADDGAADVMQVLDAEARRCWEEHKAAGTGLEPMTRRWVEWALKLALVAAAACDPDEPLIRLRHAEWAASFARYCGQQSLEAFQRNVSESAHDRNIKDCLIALDRAGRRGLTDSQRLRNVGAFKRLTPRERKDVVSQLIESGEAVMYADILYSARHAPQS